MVLRYISNQGGIPRFESNAVNIGTSNVSFSLSDAGSNFTNNFNGLILIKFNQSIASGTTTTLPIVVNNTIPVTTYGGANLTVADFKGTGIYLAYYSDKSLQLL